MPIIFSSHRKRTTFPPQHNSVVRPSRFLFLLLLRASRHTHTSKRTHGAYFCTQKADRGTHIHTQKTLAPLDTWVVVHPCSNSLQRDERARSPWTSAQHAASSVGCSRRTNKTCSKHSEPAQTADGHQGNVMRCVDLRTRCGQGHQAFKVNAKRCPLLLDSDTIRAGVQVLRQESIVRQRLVPDRQMCMPHNPPPPMLLLNSVTQFSDESHQSCPKRAIYFRSRQQAMAHR